MGEPLRALLALVEAARDWWEEGPHEDDALTGRLNNAVAALHQADPDGQRTVSALADQRALARLREALPDTNWVVAPLALPGWYEVVIGGSPVEPDYERRPDATGQGPTLAAAVDAALGSE